jgi:hypothetical protein
MLTGKTSRKMILEIFAEMRIGFYPYFPTKK